MTFEPAWITVLALMICALRRSAVMGAGVGGWGGAEVITIRFLVGRIVHGLLLVLKRFQIANL